MQFNIQWGEALTTMTRTGSKSSGHTHYDTYKIADGTTFGMYRDHFDARRSQGTRVLVVEGRDIVIKDGGAPMTAQEQVGALRKAAEWRTAGVG